MEEKVPKYISVHQVVVQVYSIYRIKMLDGRRTCMCTIEFLNNGATCNTSVKKKEIAFETSRVHNVVYTFLERDKKSFYLLVTCYKAYPCTPRPCGQMPTTIIAYTIGRCNFEPFSVQSVIACSTCKPRV
jgi:hypothetical protein